MPVNEIYKFSASPANSYEYQLTAKVDVVSTGSGWRSNIHCQCKKSVTCRFLLTVNIGTSKLHKHLRTCISNVI